ncbi:MAG: alpha hydrolase [Methanosarcinales archaeon]|jgi:predicted subunit of tRNA(5-methylaminomethyl-2-thiouridylate) methyltransferase|nr:alpha hydrolase [Methanosarcinales archaeon]
MKAHVLFSGGKDSSLSALIMEPYFDVQLVTCNFGILPTGEVARQIAAELGFSHTVIQPPMEILESAAQIVQKDGFPNGAINGIHRQVLEILAQTKGVELIADGLRRDDRVPRLEHSEIQSFEDRYKILYCSPLMGFGRFTINKMIESNLVITEEESASILKCDYEAELREYLYREIGEEETRKHFPKSHKQSRVISRIRKQ